MTNQESFPKEAKVEILEKVKNRTDFYLKQAITEQERLHAEDLLKDLDNV